MLKFEQKLIQQQSDTIHQLVQLVHDNIEIKREIWNIRSELVEMRLVLEDLGVNDFTEARKRARERLVRLNDVTID
jgi:hypothetical protein